MSDKKMRKIGSEILRLVGTGTVLYIAAHSPKGAVAIDKWIGRTLTRQARYFWQKRLLQMQLDGIVIMSGETIRLSAEGKRLLQEIEYRNITIPITTWKGIWHVVTYDIPETKKARRDAFNRRIKELGFLQVQKSVFVLPYECKEIIAILAEQFKVSPYVIYMHTQDLPMATKLKRHFGIHR